MSCKKPLPALFHGYFTYFSDWFLGQLLPGRGNSAAS
jgi:hypothetical protein